VLWDAQTENGEALLSRWQLEFSPPHGGAARPLEDPYVSRRPIRLSAARFGGIRVECTRTGTRVIANDDWISEDRVFLGVEVERGVVLVLAERLALLLHNFEGCAGEDELPSFGLVGGSALMLRLRREVRSVAADTRPVLLRGEAGTGKKAVARAIHRAGRADRPYVTIRDATAATIPDLLARAAGGTLLLDALDEVGTEFQAELRRALDGEARDVRILATVTDHRSCASSPGPLFERSDAQALEVPALGKRRDDVGRLVYHFLGAALGELAAGSRLADPGPFSPPWLPVRLVASLAGHDWPRNVGQLRRVAQQLACDHHDKPHVDVGPDLEELLEGKAASAVGWSRTASDRRAPRPGRWFGSISETELLSALRAHRWQAEPAAAHLGVSPEALFAMIEKYSERSQRRKGPRRSPPPF
jgi:two-component system nitrogen regulation response regulator GlnG